MAAKAEISKKVEELALLQVMLDSNDPGGLAAATEYCTQIAKLAEEVAELSRLAAAASYIEAQSKAQGGEAILSILGSFVSAAQAFVQGSENVQFPNEQEKSGTINSEVSPDMDEDLLVLFIEKHTLALEEFEASILAFKYQVEKEGTDESETFNKSIKNYVHTLKGDAGSIGLIGIERVSHFLEDLFGSLGPSKRLDELIQFKEWVIASIEAFSSGTTPEVLSGQIIECLKDATDVCSDSALLEEVEAQKNEEVEEAEEPTSTKAETYTLVADPVMINEFAAEAEDHLTTVESILLESDGTFSSDEIGSIFRCVHSLKGASSYFNLAEITETSHILETIYDEVRDGKRVVDPPLVALSFEYIDLQKKLLESARAAVEADLTVTRSPEVTRYLGSLNAYLEGTYEAETPTTAAASSSPTEEPLLDTTPAKTTEAKPANTKTSAQRLGVKNFIKIDTERLDSLIDSIGEMVIYSSMLVKNCRELLSDHEEVIRNTHQVEKFSRDLQDIGMSMRLDPLKALFQKMSRLVWDVSKKLGKEVQFEMTGEDTELDRTVIEKLADPLMHMVRNAVDHGIETIEDRKAAGKSPVGKVKLAASHSGGNIQIRLEDDGKGLDPDRLREKAIEKGVISPEAKLTREECFQLIFAAGFSTAAEVTDVSGRGVGMDVVRSNIESLRGRIIIDSEPGKGSTFIIELPLTLAIIDGIDCTVGEERFIVPTLSIIEIIRPQADMITNTLQHGETFEFRGRFLPVFRLSELYELQGATQEPENAALIVVENGGEQIAIMVDQIVGSCQSVLKNLGPMFKDAEGLSGCAIMSNGDIGLILDIRSLVELARDETQGDVSSEVQEKGPSAGL